MGSVATVGIERRQVVVERQGRRRLAGRLAGAWFRGWVAYVSQTHGDTTKPDRLPIGGAR